MLLQLNKSLVCSCKPFEAVLVIWFDGVLEWCSAELETNDEAEAQVVPLLDLTALLLKQIPADQVIDRFPITID